METIGLIQQYSEFAYFLSVNIATFIILKYMIVMTTSRQRVIVTALVGLVLGIIWLEMVGANIGGLILGWLAAVGFYESIIKVLMKKLQVDYD
jgi:hypothetical protein